MEKFSSSKVFDGYSTVFRQWKAEGTHCRWLHGYAISFKIEFEGKLDEKNWVWDFGGMKRAAGKIEGKNPKDWFTWLLDHTTIIAEDDPELEIFKEMSTRGIIQLRIIPATGAERFAEYLFKKVDHFVKLETEGRVKVARVEVREHERNAASYSAY